MSLGTIDEDTKGRRYYGDRATACSRRRSYSDQEKIAALEVLQANDGQIRRTAELLGIPPVTLIAWKQEADAGRIGDVERLRPLIRKVLDEECEAAAREFIAAARLPDKVEKAGTLQLMTSAGIAIDKMRLLREQATSIHTQQLSDEERIARLNELLATALSLPAPVQSEEQSALPAPALEQPDADDCS
jgi:transposase-like protein